MYISDGYVYGGESDSPLKVTNVKLLKDYKMILTFSTGDIRVFDAALLTGPIFEPLKNVDVFQNPRLEYGVVTWMDGAIDCAPEFMYDNSVEYTSGSSVL